MQRGDEGRLLDHARIALLGFELLLVAELPPFNLIVITLDAGMVDVAPPDGEENERCPSARYLRRNMLSVRSVFANSGAPTFGIMIIA